MKLKGAKGAKLFTEEEDQVRYMFSSSLPLHGFNDLVGNDFSVCKCQSFSKVYLPVAAGHVDFPMTF